MCFMKRELSKFWYLFLTVSMWLCLEGQDPNALPKICSDKVKAQTQTFDINLLTNLKKKLPSPIKVQF